MNVMDEEIRTKILEECCNPDKFSEEITKNLERALLYIEAFKEKSKNTEKQLQLRVEELQKEVLLLRERELKAEREKLSHQKRTIEDINYDQFFKIERNSWPPQRTINIHCKFNECNVIENVLRSTTVSWSTKSEYELFQGSCLRHLLQVPNNHMFSGQLMHNLLVREIKMEGASPDEMWFSIGGKKARFSKVEFCLATGLKFGPLTDICEKEYKVLNNGIHNRYFKGNMNLRLQTIFDRFQKGGFTQPRDCMKMALVLIVNNILFGQDIRRKVTPWLFSLVENEEEFNAFPWGHYVFKLTLYHLRKCLGRSNYYGFPYALQVWAIEAIMSMWEMLAVPLVDLGRNEVQMPRLLKWSFEKRPKNFLTELKTLEDVGQFTAKEVLVPTPWEEGQAYWVGIDTDLSEGPRFVPPISGE